MISFIIVVMVILLSYWWWTAGRYKNLPPTPGLALPLIGHLYLMSYDPTENFQTWRKRLGDVFMVSYGYKKVVFLSSYEAINEALVKQNASFFNRTDSLTHSVLFNKKGVASLSGVEWKEHRVFLQQTLKELGMGKNVMSERVHREIGFLLQEILESKGQPMCLRHLITASICNIISLVTFGIRHDYKDKKFIKMQESTLKNFQMVTHSSPLHFSYKIIRFLPFNLFYYKEFVDYAKEMRKYMASLLEKTVTERQDSFNIVNAYKEEMERKKLAGQINTSFCEENLLYSCWNLFAAGTDTTSTTILFGVLYLVNFPDIQEKLYQEIKEKVGTDQLPSWSCRQQLIYLNAFILETQRYCSLLPLSIDRCTEKDTYIKGYFIPKDTTTVPILDSVLWDEDIWGDPKVFRPERFIENGVITIKKEFIPFSLGRRSCLGEPMAVMELFHFLSALIQRFQFLPGESWKMPSLDSIYGFSRGPKPFKVRALPRI